jgi:SPX domain protein involved in polyphosphate accumulation
MRQGPYWVRDMEIDARKWAYEQSVEKKRFGGLVKITRQPTGQGMRLP